MNLPFLKSDPATGENSSAVTSVKKGKKWFRRLSKKKIIAIIVISALVVVIGSRFLPGGNNAPAANGAYSTATVSRRDITSSITGSGTLEAADSYSVTTLIEGTILTASFEEGDQVEKDTILYTIDSSDASSSLEQAEISLGQAQRNYQKQLDNMADLNVTSTIAGRVYSIDVEIGDEVKSGQTIATVRDSDTMELEITFPADDSSQFYVGQPATVTLDSTFETLSGTVSEVNGNVEVLSGNVMVRWVTIQVNNPGALSTQQSATAAVGSITSTGSGTFTYTEEKVITAKVAGDVASIPVSEGDRVSKGQTLVVLTSDDVKDSVLSASDSLRNAEISLENRYDQLEDYTITSPIQGTIIDKNYNAGETTEANQVLCTIYDLSYLTMTLSVDELDIANIEVGQTVEITADAIDDKIFEGVVTKVSVAGTASGGVTTYPVTIRIYECGGLLPGMNVDATIVLESASDVLAIPSSALQRGNTVLVTADSPSAANGTPLAQAGNEEDASGAGSYVSVPVTIGVGDDNYIEVTSGLQEGDTVAYIPTTSSTTMFPMGMMSGGMPGGMAGGGMPGGMPGGGMGGGGMPGGR